MKRPIMLPAGVVKDDFDVMKQLGIHEPPKKMSMWPWIVAIVGCALAACAGAVAGAIIFFTR